MSQMGRKLSIKFRLIIPTIKKRDSGMDSLGKHVIMKDFRIRIIKGDCRFQNAYGILRTTRKNNLIKY